MSNLTFIPVKMRLPLKFGTETIHDIQVAHVELEAYGITAAHIQEKAEEIYKIL